MDVLILGGGYGTRLFGHYNRETYHPKGLIKIREKLCIEHILVVFSNNLIDEIILETNNEGKPFYKNWLNESRFKDRTEIFVEPISTPDNCMGVLKTIEIVSNFYRFQKPILILSPDNVFTETQDELIINYISGVRIATYELDSLNNAKKYGVVVLDADSIINCIEKPSDPKSRIIRTSCEIWDTDTFALIQEWNTKFDSNKVGDFIGYLINMGIKVESYKIKGEWIDIGNKEDLSRSRKMLK